MTIRLLAVDGFNLIRRIYEAILYKSKGENKTKSVNVQEVSQVVEATKSSLARALKEHEPSHAAVVMDQHIQTWRHLLYSDYKANRAGTPAILMSNIAYFTEAFASLGVKSFSVDGYEADDIVATMATSVSKNHNEVIILSTDKAYLQLMNDSVVVFDHFAKKRFNRAYIQQKYGVSIEQYIDYLALVGAGSNNIKGVQGIGPKSAVSLLSEFGSLDCILSDKSQSALTKKVKASRSEAIRSRLLVTLKVDVELGQNLKSFRL